MTGEPEAPGKSRRREWVFYLAVALWIAGIQIWLGPRIRDYAVDNSLTLQVIEGRRIELPREDPRDLYRRRAGEIRDQLLRPIRRPDPAGVWKMLAQNYVHPPLYFWLLQLWIFGFGNHPISWAFFSGLQMIGAGLLLFRLARSELDPITALLPPLCFAVSLPILNQSQTLRHYLLIFLLTCLGLLLAYPASRPLSEDPPSPKFHWVGLALALAAGLATHYLFCFIVMGINLAVLPGLRRAPQSRQRQWAGAQLLAAILFAPIFPLFLAQFQREQNLELFNPVSSIPAGALNAYVGYFFRYPGWLTFPLLLVLGLSLAAYLRRRPGPLVRFHLGLCLMAFGLYPYLVWTGLFRMSGAMMPRFFLPAAPVVLLLPALGTARLPRTWMRAFLTLLLPALMLFHAQSYAHYLGQLETKLQPASLNRNRLFAEFVSRNLDAGDVLLLETEELSWLAVSFCLRPAQTVWYGPVGGVGEGLRRLPADVLGPDRPRRILYATAGGGGREASVQATLDLISRTHRVLPQKLVAPDWRIYFFAARENPGAKLPAAGPAGGTP